MNFACCDILNLDPTSTIWAGQRRRWAVVDAETSLRLNSRWPKRIAVGTNSSLSICRDVAGGLYSQAPSALAGLLIEFAIDIWGAIDRREVTSKLARYAVKLKIRRDLTTWLWSSIAPAQSTEETLSTLCSLNPEYLQRNCFTVHFLIL